MSNIFHSVIITIWLEFWFSFTKDLVLISKCVDFSQWKTKNKQKRNGKLFWFSSDFTFNKISQLKVIRETTRKQMNIQTGGSLTCNVWCCILYWLFNSCSLLFSWTSSWLAAWSCCVSRAFCDANSSTSTFFSRSLCRTDDSYKSKSK